MISAIITITFVDNILRSESLSVYLASVAAKLSDDNSYIRLLAHLISLALITNSSGGNQMDIVEKLWSAMAINELSGIDDLSREHLGLEVISNQLFFFLSLINFFRNQTTLRSENILLRNPTARSPCAGHRLQWL